MHGYSKKEKPPISCAHAHSLCVVRVKKRKEKVKTLNEKKTKKNLILSHVNQTFSIFEPSNWTQAFRHTHCSLGKNVFLKVKKLPIQGSICFKLVPGPLSKVTLIPAG
jgi:hypothetical protein